LKIKGPHSDQLKTHHINYWTFIRDALMHDVEVSSQNSIAVGIFTCVHRISDRRVRKVPRNNEANVYALVGEDDHIAICTSAGQTEDYVELEWAVNGTLEDYVQRYKSRLTHDFRLLKVREIIEAVEHIHLRGVVHSDMCLRQFLLYEDLLARLSDFSASGYQGHDALGMENASHYMPRDPDLPDSIQSDIFALGSTLYKLMAEETPYHGKSDDEIQSLYEQAIFPYTNGLLCGDVISNSWKGNLSSANEVLAGLRQFSSEPGANSRRSLGE
jgi:serine/threonine protein kinase